MSWKLSQRLRTLVGVVWCAALSALLSLVFASRASRTLIPLAFVAVIVALASRYGAAVGILGSMVAAVIFSVFLFPPLHRVGIESPAARANIGWMLLAGITLSYLLAGRPHTPRRE